MFFFRLARSVNEILLILAAIIPAAVIFIYVYRKDTVEHEPKPMLISLLLSGMLAGTAAGTLEALGTKALSLVLPKNSLVYLVLMAFLIVGAAEEGMKLLVLRVRTWNSKHFNYTFDAIVYGVTVSLGFAALENIFYVLDGGFATALARAVLSVPGHAAWGVVMGFYYGQAKVLSVAGEKEASDLMMKRAFVVPMLLHGFFDTCAFIGGPRTMGLLYLFSFAVDVIVIRRLESASSADRLVGPVGGAFTEEGPHASALPGVPTGYGVAVPAPAPAPAPAVPAAPAAAAPGEGSSFCPRCGTRNPGTHAFCFSCGQKLR